MHRRTFSLAAEMGFLVLVILVWQAARIPAEGSLGVALSHGHSWLALERHLHLQFEFPLIRAAHDAGLARILEWVYPNVQLVGIFTFMVAARLAAPGRYPQLRSAFVLSHVPALALIAAYPLAPPAWLPGTPHSTGPPQSLNDGLGPALKNSTAAAVSMHFGYALFIAAGIIWLMRARPSALVALVWPAAIFVIIVATGNHYVLDSVFGAAAVGIGALAAFVLHRGATERVPAPAPALEIARLAAAVALAAYALTAVLAGHFPLRVSPPLLALPLAALLAVRPWRRVPEPQAERAYERRYS